MRALFAILKKELIGYFVTPVAYVFIAIFVFTSSAFTFYLGNFYASNQAGLEKFFIWHPWLYLFLIPSISMRLWAEERKSGTLELLNTLPIPVWQMVFGKFLASWLFTGIAILCTVPMWITVCYLGDPDNGVIFASYLGSFLMAGAYLSVGSCISSLTKSQVVSFIVSVVVCFIFTISGFSFILNFLQGFLSQPVIDVISSFSFISNFSEITKGILEINSIGFFLIVIFLFLFINVCLLSKDSGSFFNKFRFGQRLNLSLVISLAVILFFSLNIIMNYSMRGVNFDLTENKIYTLSKGTKNILSNLKEPVHIRFFYSQKQGSSISFLHSYSSRVKALLKQYKSLSKGKLELDFIFPEAFSKEEDEAVSYGIQAIPLSDNMGSKLYFGLVATNTTDDIKLIEFINPNREAFLEYDLTQMIYELSNYKKSTIGFMNWLDSEAPSPYGGMNMMGMGSDNKVANWMLFEKIKEIFDFKDVDKNLKKIPSDIDTLLLLHPSGVSEDLEYAIDQFVLKGGKLLVFVDPYSELPAVANKSSNLERLFRNWGISLDSSKIVLDIDNSIRISSNSGGSVLSNMNKPNWIALGKKYFNEKDIVTSELNQIRFISGGNIEVSDLSDDVEFTTLLTSGKNSMLISVDKLYDTESLLTGFVSENKEFILAGRLRGKFKTSFPERKEEGHLEKSQDTGNIIIVADTDLLRDQFWLQKQSFFGRSLILQVSDNASFVVNALDNLSGSSDLIGLRSRSKIERPFKVVQKLRNKAESKFLEKEKMLKLKLQSTESKLSQMRTGENKEGESVLFITDEQKNEIEKFREEMLNTRKQLREVSRSLNKNIESLGSLLKFIHIMVIPLIIVLLGFFMPSGLGIKKS